MNIQIYAVIVALFIGGLLGHTYTKHYYEAEIAKLNAEGMAADVKALETQIKTERDYKDVQDKAEKTALADYASIGAKYSLALSRGMLESSRSTDTTKVPNTTTTASQTTKTCNCGRLRQNYENLRKDCLLIAKERDELAVDRNELIRLYNQIWNSR
jgi:hypothetical protein